MPSDDHDSEDDIQLARSAALLSDDSIVQRHPISALIAAAIVGMILAKLVF